MSEEFLVPLESEGSSWRSRLLFIFLFSALVVVCFMYIQLLQTPSQVVTLGNHTIYVEVNKTVDVLREPDYEDVRRMCPPCIQCKVYEPCTCEDIHKGLTNAEVKWLLNKCTIKEGSSGYQAGSYDTCDKVREYLKVKGRNEYRSLPKNLKNQG